jgi:hypothetical protein
MKNESKLLKIHRSTWHRRNAQPDFDLPGVLRAILNFTPGPQGWNLSPSGNVPPFVHTPGVNTLYCLEEWRGTQRSSPLGDKSPLWYKIHPWGSKFAPRGEVKNGPLLTCPCVINHSCVPFRIGIRHTRNKIIGKANICWGQTFDVEPALKTYYICTYVGTHRSNSPVRLSRNFLYFYVCTSTLYVITTPVLWL